MRIGSGCGGQKEQSGFFFENRLHVYFIWDPRIHAKLYHSAQQNRRLGGFTLSQKKAIQRARKEHETYLAEFESILRGIEGSMEAASLGPRRLVDTRTLRRAEARAASDPARSAAVCAWRGDDRVPQRAGAGGRGEHPQ